MKLFIQRENDSNKIKNKNSDFASCGEEGEETLLREIYKIFLD
jgi:hypothetical protein